MITVYIADDHQLMRDGLRRLLEETGRFEVLGEAEDCTTAIREVIRLKPDVALLDVSMPGVGGIETARLIHKEAPRVSLLMVTAQPEELYAVRCLRAGASGFLHKRGAARELVQAIDRICAGGRYLSPDVATTLVMSVAGETGEQPHEKLSDRELQVLIGVAQGQSSSDIASELHLSVKTVSTYRGRIAEKLDLHSTVDIVRYALAHQLID